MTPRQKTSYWSRWAAVVRRNHWRMAERRLDGRAIENRNLTDPHRKVWRHAEERALRKHRAVTAEDLRHACHIVATGRDISSKALTNKQVTATFALFAALAHPDDLDRMHMWSSEERRQRVWYIGCIENLQGGPAYAASVSKDIWKTDRWRDLPIADLLGLMKKIQKRLMT